MSAAARGAASTAHGERSSPRAVLVGRHQGHKAIGSQFTREDAQAAAAKILEMPSWKPHRLALDVYYAARDYEKSVPWPRGGQIRRELTQIRGLAKRHATKENVSGLRTILGRCPEIIAVHLGFSDSDSFFLYLSNHRKSASRVFQKDILFRVRCGINALDLEADRGGSLPFDDNAFLLLYTLKIKYEEHTDRGAKHWRDPLSDEEPFPSDFSNLCFSVGQRVTPAIGEAKVDDLLRQILHRPREGRAGKFY